MQNCDLVQDKDRMFSGREYLLADSGFVPDITIIPCFKKPAHGSLNTEQKIFNKQLSSFRVCNEHCIGLLKGRFQSLKCLRLRLQDEDDAQRIIAWIISCAVLHNLLLSEDFDWVDIDVDEDGDEQDEEYQAGSVGDTPGKLSDGVLQED
ncbi:hypothetical protein PsorP6_009709 [Peronosclerospora sorghi]|uniref:Uncharacterized protein n=1 Tax=Peronosclerospora sorghi TaxID=230839 RepID=A0ACC0VYK9_9STRA|nr:hypothetical protein PsorP6_009709 [Peronosclerospora sorghi]